VRDISAIVCTHRIERWPSLLECLASLDNQSLQPLEIIVVVDGEPEIRERLNQRAGPVITLSTPRPSGLSVARNLGLARASGTFVAFIDDDAVAEESWLKTLRAVLEDETVAGVGGSSLPDWEGNQPGWIPEELLWAVGCSYRGMPTTQSEVRNVYGGSACFRRDIFTRFGGFDVNLGRTAVGLAGCEETELCLRVQSKSRGLRFVHEPRAVIHHRVPAERQKAGYLLSRCASEGRSKAILRVINGARSNRPLACEASYLFRTVPRGMAAAVRRFLGGDRWGLVRAALLAVAASATVLAYAATRMQSLLGALALQPAAAAPRSAPQQTESAAEAALTSVPGRANR
jgi:glucosyl-dolichyl phosphate glucuronosyltransferase